jgi:predicted glycosyltransferase
MEILRDRGDELLVLSRVKDVACGLLDSFGIPHLPVSRAGSGRGGLAAELLRRDLAVLSQARRFRPDAMLGFGGVAISHAGKLLGVPAISFYDSENARLQTRITWPFIGRLYVPEAYAGPTPEGRTTRLPGTKELSYLHPAAFRPDRGIALAGGLDPDRDNVFLRVVDWRANHDLGKAGWSLEELRSLVARLGKDAKVHLSSEVALPEDLAMHRYRGSIQEVHHLMAHCRLYLGESATMASEAAILGVPAIYCGRDFPGYVRELEAAGLMVCRDGGRGRTLQQDLENQLAREPEEMRAARDRYVAGKPDWAEEVVEALGEAVRLRSPRDAAAIRYSH